jgi:hypothetical protein
MIFRRIASTATLTLLAAVAVSPLRGQNAAPPPTPSAASTIAAPLILHPADLANILPAAVFFRGQTATLQARNSGGVRWPGDFLTFAAAVDTAGYSTSIQQKYQIYLITEVPLLFDGKQILSAGAYGVGFEAGGGFVVMDIGGQDLFTMEYVRDSVLKRPMPLAVTAGPEAGTFRLYAGRNYITFSSTAKPS